MGDNLEKAVSERIFKTKEVGLYERLERCSIARTGLRRTHSIIEQCDIGSLPVYSDDPLEGTPWHEDYMQG